MIKALSWRVASLIVTVTVVKLATGDTQTAAVVGTADALIKVGLYYLHERAWIGIRLGRGGQPKAVVGSEIKTGE